MLYYVLHPMLGLPYYGIGFTPQYVYPPIYTCSQTRTVLRHAEAR